MAFMKFDMDRSSILKNGSRTGNFSEPQRTTCSRMWAIPVSHIGTVLTKTLYKTRTVVKTVGLKN